MMIFIAVGVLAIIAVLASVRAFATDGYRHVPTAPIVRHPDGVRWH
ncbi:MAG: hypothetical protein Q8M65_04245 [Rhodoglobus sp.]|nr:hypothetical protein [Rhodoglobus sp.]